MHQNPSDKMGPNPIQKFRPRGKKMSAGNFCRLGYIFYPNIDDVLQMYDIYVLVPLTNKVNKC